MLTGKVLKQTDFMILAKNSNFIQVKILDSNIYIYIAICPVCQNVFTACLVRSEKEKVRCRAEV